MSSILLCLSWPLCCRTLEFRRDLWITCFGQFSDLRGCAYWSLSLLEMICLWRPSNLKRIKQGTRNHNSRGTRYTRVTTLLVSTHVALRRFHWLLHQMKNYDHEVFPVEDSRKLAPTPRTSPGESAKKSCFMEQHNPLVNLSIQGNSERSSKSLIRENTLQIGWPTLW
jgi:hypothetical protein